MSLPDGLNKVKLGYGKFAVTSIQQSGSGNLVTVSADYMPSVNDYVIFEGNSNGPGVFVKVTSTPSGTTFRINSTIGAGTVSGGNLWLGKELSVLHSDDENIQIVGREVVRLDKIILENLKGYRTVLSVRTEALSNTERLFMYQFAKADYQSAEIFGTLYADVLLVDADVVMDLIDNYILATPLSFTMVERNLTVPSAAYAVGSTDSQGYSALSSLGTRVKLTMNWGSGDISRNFTVNMANIYNVKLERKDFTHIDESLGRVNFGFRPMCQLDFGTFGFQTDMTSLQDDLAWVKNFCLAPSKHIEVYEVFQADVVNNFSDVTVGYIGGYVFARTLSLSFKGKSIQSVQSNASGVFTLDDNTLGLLDSNNLG